jgi:Flp pilus assembly protein TadG
MNGVLLLSPSTRDCRGTAAVEFGLVVPVLVALLIGACDVGFMFYRQMQVDAAAWAGATYASKHGWNNTTQALSTQSQDNILTAAQDATSLGSGVTATATLTTGCLNTTTGQLYPSGNANCTNNVTSGTYVTVATSYGFSTLISYPGWTTPGTLTGTANVRIQ